MPNRAEQRKISKRTYSEYADIDMLFAAYNGDMDLVKTALEGGADVNMADEQTGLTALHVAVGTGNLPLARMLVEEWNAAFLPDKFGRHPSVVAAQCNISNEVGDYIVRKEAEDLWGPPADWPPGIVP